MCNTVSTTVGDHVRLCDARSALLRIRKFSHRFYYANAIAYVAGCKRLKVPDVYPCYLEVNRDIQEMINQEAGLTCATISGFRRNLMCLGRWPDKFSEAVKRACLKIAESHLEQHLISVSSMNTSQSSIYWRLKQLLDRDPDADVLARLAVSRNIRF